MRSAQASELMELLDIQFEEITVTRVSGSIAADERHHQPWGLVHGGLYTTVIETFATTGTFEAVKGRGQHAVDVSNATDFLRPHRTGRCTFSKSRSSRDQRSSCGRSRSAGQTTTSSSPAGQVRLPNIDAPQDG